MVGRKAKFIIGLAFASLTSVALAYGPQWGGPGSGYPYMQTLNLTTEQQEQVREIIQQHHEEAMQWRAEHHKALSGKLSSVLNAEQLEQFEAIKQQGPFGRGMNHMGPYGRGMHHMGPYGRTGGPCGRMPYQN